MKILFLCVSICLSCDLLLANESVKKAFTEGIKASVEVVKYEKSQALKAIPEGYCVTVLGTQGTLDMWEAVKLESLALFLKLDPSLLVSNKNQRKEKRILCLSISKQKKQAIEALTKIRKFYPKIEEYITKVEILPTKTLHRMIPGVGAYFENKKDEVRALKSRIQPERAINGRIVLLSENENSKIHFDNGSTRVVGTPLKNVMYIEHTVYMRKSQ